MWEFSFSLSYRWKRPLFPAPVLYTTSIRLVVAAKPSDYLSMKLTQTKTQQPNRTLTPQCAI